MKRALKWLRGELDCPFCGKRFTSQRALDNHMRVAH